MSEDVLTQTHDAVLLVTLNRPEALNALTSAMTDRLVRVLDDADRSDSVRAVVLTGAGRGFCAGADTSTLGGLSGEDLSATDESLPRHRIFHMRTPVIAAVNGPVAGMGLSMALMADVRIASTTANVTTAFARFGLVAEHGSSFLLQQVVGRAHALDLLLSGRKVDAATAFRMGLFQSVHEPDELLAAALDYARQVAGCSSFSTSQMKEQVAADATRGFREAYDDSMERMVHSLGRDEFRERASAASRKARR